MGAADLIFFFLIFNGFWMWGIIRHVWINCSMGNILSKILCSSDGMIADQLWVDEYFLFI